MEKKTVRFKSVPENFEKEKSGLKPNTVRHFDEGEKDVREELLNAKAATHIEIVNSETGEIFEREISDITYWDEQYVISWLREPEYIGYKTKVEKAQEQEVLIVEKNHEGLRVSEEKAFLALMLMGLLGIAIGVIIEALAHGIYAR